MAPSGTRPGRHKDDDALAALIAAGHTAKDAAAQAGVSERTAARRMADPAFRAKVADTRKRFVETTTAKLQSAAVGAVDVLTALLGHDDAHVRKGAAVEVLRHTVKVTEHAELAERIAKLEELLTRQGKL